MAIVVHHGKIIDASGEGLWGAHIVSDLNIGTTSDFDGNFQIAGEAGKEYTIGHLGKKSRTITLKKGMPAEVYTLYDDAIVLDEFIGTPPKKESNYALGLIAFVAAIFIGKKIFN